MRDELIGHLCSILRVVAVAAAVFTAYGRLQPEDFVTFSQFHVGLSMAGFLECAAVIERSKLYADGEAGATERAALLLWARRVGWVCLLVGIGVSTAWLLLGAVIVGAGIACLALPESSVLRDSSAQAARLELTALIVALAIVAASWLAPVLHVGAAAAMLGVLACAPRLTLSTMWRPSAASAPLMAARRALVRNWRSIAPFAANQAALPWFFAIPNYAVPQYLPARESSWILLGLRASGAVASMLARTLVQRWIRLADGHHLGTTPRRPLIALGVAFLAVSGGDALGLGPAVVAGLFAAFLSLACALQAFLSTHLNARGHYLIQLPAYALFWLPGSAALALISGTARAGPSLFVFTAVQSAGACLAVAAMTVLSVRLNDTRPTSADRR